jgi:OmpA-OmpF porin, OOP family
MLNRKIMLGVAALGLSTLVVANSYAATSGYYLGGQVGYGNVHQADISENNMTVLMAAGLQTNRFTVSSFGNNGKDSGVAGRLFAGYQFNPNWAAELGWSKFSNFTSSASLTAIDRRFGSLNPVATASAKGTVKTDAVDLVAKGIYPITNGVNVYGKLGAAYVMSRAEVSGSVSEGIFTVAKFEASENEHKVFPTAGAGISYDVTNNVSADLSYNRIQKVGSSTSIGSTDLVSVGLIYNIG